MKNSRKRSDIAQQDDDDGRSPEIIVTDPDQRASLLEVVIPDLGGELKYEHAFARNL